MGTIRPVRPGVWRLRVSNGVDAVDGRRRMIDETFNGSERAARARLAEMETDARRGAAAASAITLRRAITVWRAQAGHERGTAAKYDLAVATIPERVLATPIEKIRAATLRELLARVTAEHNVHRARAVHAVISGALSHAWRQEWIVDNVARRVQPPAQPRRRATNPDANELRRVLAVLEHDVQFATYLRVAAITGARPQELAALHWSDVDLDRGEVDIHRKIERVSNEERDGVKADGDRKVAIGDRTVAALRRWRAAFLERALAVGVAPVADPYVFTNSLDGADHWRTDYATKRFARICTAAARLDDDLTPIPPTDPGRPIRSRQYDLRHFCATELLAANVPMKTVQDRLGHRRITTTGDIYAHALPAGDLAAAALLDELLG